MLNVNIVQYHVFVRFHLRDIVILVIIVIYTNPLNTFVLGGHDN